VSGSELSRVGTREENSRVESAAAESNRVSGRVESGLGSSLESSRVSSRVESRLVVSLGATLVPGLLPTPRPVRVAGHRHASQLS